VELLDLSVWPSDFSLGGGCWLFNSPAFFWYASLYEDEKRVRQEGFGT